MEARLLLQVSVVYCARVKSTDIKACDQYITTAPSCDECVYSFSDM